MNTFRTPQTIRSAAATAQNSPMTGSPAKRALPPALAKRAQMVKEAHQHLAASVPEYSKVGSRQKFMMAQHHVNVRLGKVK